MASVFVRNHLANDGFGDALNVSFGEMCTPRCDTCFMSILVGISLFMAIVSALIVIAIEFISYPSQRSFSTAFLRLYSCVVFAVFVSFAVWFGLIDPRLAS